MKEWLNGKKNRILLLFCLMSGIIFLILSEYSRTDEKVLEKSFDPACYTQELEARLADTISAMAGVGKVKVMVMLESQEEYRYAAQTGASLSGEISYFLQDENHSPVLSTVNEPSVRGACVVCDGAEDPQLRLRITRLIASTLNLSENQIYVTV